MIASAVWIVSRRPDGVPVMTPAAYITAAECDNAWRRAMNRHRVEQYRANDAWRVTERVRDRMRKQRLRQSRRAA